jgi:hypothetical protein
MLTLAFTGCPEPSSSGGTSRLGEQDDLIYGATTRYLTVPFDSSSGRSAAGIDNLLYTAQDNSHYYYVFLLGHIDLVPVAYREPVIYNGVTNAIVRYEKSNATQDSFSQSVSNAFQHSVSNKTTTNFGIVAKAGVDLGPFSASVKTSYSNQVINEESSTRSFESTWGTASTKISSYTNTLEMIIGNNNEPAGKYRYSLFCTTDVYFVVKTNKAKTQVVDSYTSFCARADSFAWGIDYEPDLGGNFGRTAEGNLLQIPQLTLSSLPTPTETIDYFPDDPNKVAAPYAGTPAGAYPVTQRITLSTPTEGAVIYYTTDGSVPTTSSAYYITPIPIAAGDTTIKAIAVKPGMTNSNVFTANYVILPFVTEYITRIRPGIGLSGSSNQTGSILITHNIYDHFTTNFDPLRLHAEGYNKLEIELSAQIFVKAPTFAQFGSTGTIRYHIVPGHTNSHSSSYNGQYGYKDVTIDHTSGWKARYYTFTFNVDLSQYNNQLTVSSDGNGLIAEQNRMYIGETFLRVTAKK